MEKSGTVYYGHNPRVQSYTSSHIFYMTMYSFLLRNPENE